MEMIHAVLQPGSAHLDMIAAVSEPESQGVVRIGAARFPIQFGARTHDLVRAPCSKRWSHVVSRVCAVGGLARRLLYPPSRGDEPRTTKGENIMSTTKQIRVIAVLKLPLSVPQLIKMAQAIIAALTGNLHIPTPNPPLPLLT